MAFLVDFLALISSILLMKTNLVSLRLKGVAEGKEKGEGQRKEQIEILCHEFVEITRIKKVCRPWSLRPTTT